MEECIFCKIRDRKIPSTIHYEDEDVMVFPDIHPVRPIHFLVVPKKHIADLLDADDPLLPEKLLRITQKLIREQGLSNNGYRIVVNGGGAQLVYHLHIHVMGPMKPTDKF